MASKSRTLTDHEQIRRWAEERNAKPSCVIGTGGGNDTGMIRLDFPGYSGESSLQQISWDDWFSKFDESRLALLVQDTTAGGQKSNFNKLIARETAEQGGRAHRSARRRSSGRQGRRSSASRGRSQRSAGTRSQSNRGKRSSSSRSRSSSSSRRSSGSSRRSSSSSRRSSSSGSRTRSRSGSQSRNRKSSADSQSRSRRSSSSSNRRSSKSGGSRSSRSRSNNSSRSNNKQNRRGTRRVTLTIPKDVRIEGKGSRGRGKRAA